MSTENETETRPEVRPAYRQREHGECSVLSGKARTGNAASEDQISF